MNAFRHGEFPGVASVAALGKGIDIPDVKCLILARPLNRGFMAHMQMIGRGLRTAAGKSECLILDFSGNIRCFYEPMMEFMEKGVPKLDDRKMLNVKRAEKEKSEITCAGCGIVLSPGARACPSCGLERTRRSEVENIPGTMISIDAISKGKRGWSGTEEELWIEVCTHAAKFLDRHGDLDRAHRQAKAQFKELAGRWPSSDFRFIPKSSGKVSKMVQRKIDQNYRRWKKEQEARRA